MPGLILSRKEGDEILIGGVIRVRVHEIRGKYVKLAVVAPRAVQVCLAERAGEREMPGERVGLEPPQDP